MGRKSTFIVGTIVGGAVGSIVGLLVAPKSGKETRTDIAKKANDLAGTPKKRKSILRSVLKALAGTTTLPPKRPS